MSSIQLTPKVEKIASIFYIFSLNNDKPKSSLQSININNRVLERRPKHGSKKENLRCYEKTTLRKVKSNKRKKETLAQVFSCEFCEISKNTYFYRTLLVAASVHIHEEHTKVKEGVFNETGQPILQCFRFSVKCFFATHVPFLEEFNVRNHQLDIVN